MPVLIFLVGLIAVALIGFVLHFVGRLAFRIVGLPYNGGPEIILAAIFGALTLAGIVLLCCGVYAIGDWIFHFLTTLDPTK